MYKWKITVEYQRDTSVPEISRKTEKFFGNLKMHILFSYLKKSKKFVKISLHELMLLKGLTLFYFVRHGCPGSMDRRQTNENNI